MPQFPVQAGKSICSSSIAQDFFSFFFGGGGEWKGGIPNDWVLFDKRIPESCFIGVTHFPLTSNKNKQERINYMQLTQTTFLVVNSEEDVYSIPS